MNIQDILTRFALIANLTLEEASPWLTLCSDAAEEIKMILKETVNVDANSRRLTTAAAALTFYKYTLYRSSGTGMEKFNAGDIKIENDFELSVKIAKKIWNEAKDSICDIINDKDFYFGQVK